MNNFTSMVMAVLEKLEILTHTEAEALVKEIHSSTLPDNYSQCVDMVEKVFSKLEIKSIHAKVTPTIKSAIDPLIESSKVTPTKPTVDSTK